VGDADLVGALLAEGEEKANVVGEDGHTALTKATKAHHTAVVRALLFDEAAGADCAIDATSGEGMSALMYASSDEQKALVEEDVEILGLLLEKGADVNQVCGAAAGGQPGSLTGMTTMGIAVMCGCLAVTEALLAHGQVDLHAIDYDGMTAMDHAQSRLVAAQQEGRGGDADAQPIFEALTEAGAPSADQAVYAPVAGGGGGDDVFAPVAGGLGDGGGGV